MKNKTLYLIRHGETHSNLGDVVQGWDEPLTLRGERQAKRLGERIFKHREQYPFDVIYVSRMARARMTADTAAYFASHERAPMEIIESPHLHERLHPSYLHGLSTKDPMAERALTEMRANFHNPTFDYADGETFAQLIDRVDLAINELMNDPREHIAVVSHGVFLAAVVNRLMDGAHLTSHVMARRNIIFPNASIAKATHAFGRRFDGHGWGWNVQLGDNSHTFDIE